MNNVLIKDTTIEEQTTLVTIPATPYRPPQPARTVYEMRNVCMFRYSGPGHYVFSTDPMTGKVSGMFVPDKIVGQGGLLGQWSCQDQIVPVDYPAVPAQPYVPATTYTVKNKVTGFNLGWNSGARSIAFFTEDGYVEFKVNMSVVGVICGINFYDGVDSGYNGNTIDYAFYCARGHAWIMRNGILGSGVGTYTNDTVFHIERSGTSISWQMDGTEVAADSSSVPTESGWLEASLYSASDLVFDPSVHQVSAPDTSDQTAELDGAMAPPEMFATSGAYQWIVSGVAGLRMSASSGAVVPSYAVALMQLAEPSMTADSLTGEIGSVGGALSPMRVLAADHPYGEMFVAMEPPTMAMSALEGNLNASLASQAFASSTATPYRFLAVTMNSSGTFTATLVPQSVVPAEMFAAATLGSDLAVQQVLSAVMLSLATSGDVLAVPDVDNETWIVNLDSGGSTTYSNYAYNSFAFIGGKYYGAGPAGIFELQGDTDAGEPIRASLSLGKLDFGTATRKTVSECYVGMSGKGNLFVKVIAEGNAYIYKTRSYSDNLEQQRVKFGKGLKANYVELEIYNEEGADFEVDTVQFNVADLSRKI